MPDPLALVELGGVILGLAVLARVSGRLSFSPVPLCLLGGLAFGEGGILPLAASETFAESGADIGLVLLLFMMGLEYSAEELRSSLRLAAPAGVLDAALNSSTGLASGLLLGWDPLSAAFLGGVTYISSSGVASKLIHDLGWIGNRETPVVLSVLVVEDLAMALFLPIVSVLATGGGAVSTLVRLAVALAVVAFVLLMALRHGEIISRTVFSRPDEALLLSILGMALLIAGLAERARVSAAVGAFFAGIALSGPAASRARTLLGPLRDLFATVFFLFFGLRADPASIPPVLGSALALAAVSGGTKLVTGWWAARRAGVGTRGRWRTGALLIPRAEFSIAIAGLGLATGLERELGPISTAYVLALAVAGPIVTKVVQSFGPPAPPPAVEEAPSTG